MQTSKLLISLILFVLVNLSGCRSEPDDASKITPQTTASSIYITAEDYLKLHPDQQAKTDSFSQAVQAPAQPIPAHAQGKEISIAIVYPGEQASDYWRRSLKSFTARLEEIGIRHVIHEFFSKGGGVETRRQNEQLKQALNLDPDYLVFTLDVQQHTKTIERIITRQRPYLILQNITTPLRIWEGNQPFYVGFDHAIGSKMIADYFLQKVGSGDPYGLLYYSKGYVSSMRGDTFLQYVKKMKNLKLAGSYYTNGIQAQAKSATLQLLENNEDLRFIYTCATDVALGAIAGLREAGKTGQIMLNGWGGGSAELEAIRRGELDVTVMRMNDDNGVAMAEVIRLRLLGLEDQIPTVFSGQFTLVTGNTSVTEVEKLKRRAFRYSGVNRDE